MDQKTKKRQKLIRFSTFVASVITILLLFQIRDFIEAAISKENDYEIRYEEPIGVTNHQKVYRLYKNGEQMDDIDYNQYTLLDEKGNMDLRYCALMNEARNLAYSLILGVMMIFVILIANNAYQGTPFTHQNANFIRVIGGLQFALAIVPGLVVFLMNFFKFEYANLSLEWNGFYMFVIGFAIMVLAQVFDYGVRLQEDVDSIA